MALNNEKPKRSHFQHVRNKTPSGMLLEEYKSTMGWRDAIQSEVKSVLFSTSLFLSV